MGFKTTIVTSNNVAPSILWLVSAMIGARARGGGGGVGAGVLCAAFCEGIDN